MYDRYSEAVLSGPPEVKRITAKSPVNKLDGEDRVERLLYLAPSEDALRFVSRQFRKSPRHVCFGLLTEWHRRLLDMEVFDWQGHECRPLGAALTVNHRAPPIPGLRLS